MRATRARRDSNRDSGDLVIAKKPSEPAAALFEELRRRQFDSIDDCRRAWEGEGDPLAVCVAVTKSDLPEWLSDALVVLLTLDAGEPGHLAARWKRRTADDLRAHRAQEVAALAADPALPFKWEYVFDSAAMFFEKSGRGRVSDAAMKRAYNEVKRDINGRTGAYFRAPGFNKKRIEVLTREQARLEDLLQKKA